MENNESLDADYDEIDDERPTEKKVSPFVSPELEKIRREWYGQTFVLFEIAKCARDRELAFLGNKTVKKSLPAIRCMRTEAIDFLKMNFEKFRFYQRNFDVFTSISQFKNFPMFSFNPVKRKAQLNDFFQLGGFDLSWVGMDFVIDIDNEDLSKSYSDAKKLKKVLDEFSVPYSLRFSGRAGFHFVVADKDFFPPEIKTSDKVNLAYNIAENLKEIENIKSIDLKIYDRERLLKCPFTLVDEKICLPLTDDEFERWAINKMNWAYVQKNFMLKNRGLLTRERVINFKGLMDVFGEEYE